MEVIMIWIVAWLTANTGLEPYREFPTVTFVDQCTLSREYGYEKCNTNLEAAYFPAKNKILLKMDIDPRKKEDLGTMVHELYHWLQRDNNIFEEDATWCLIKDLEVPAYEITIKFKEEFGGKTGSDYWMIAEYNGRCLATQYDLAQ